MTTERVAKITLWWEGWIESKFVPVLKSALLGVNMKLFSVLRCCLIATTLAVMFFVVAATPAKADNLVQNGNFTDVLNPGYSLNGGGPVCQGVPTCSASGLADWGDTCATAQPCTYGSTPLYLLFANTGGSAYRYIGLDTPSTNPPGGGNYIASDGDQGEFSIF